MNLEPENVDDLETASLASTATDDAVWTGGYFSYGAARPSSRRRSTWD